MITLDTKIKRWLLAAILSRVGGIPLQGGSLGVAEEAVMVVREHGAMVSNNAVVSKSCGVKIV